MNARDQAIINALLKISRICGVFPSEKPSRLFYSYQVLLFGSTLSFGLFSIYKTHFNNFVEDNSLDIFIKTITLSINVLLSISMQFSSLWRPERWRNFYESLKIGCTTDGRRNKSVVLEVLAVNTFFLARLSFVTYALYSLLGMRVVLNNLFIPIIDYYSIIFVLIIVHVNCVIKKKFLLINIFLRRARSIKQTQECYTKTKLLLDDFNRLFGYQIFYLTIRCIFIILECLHNGLKFTNSQHVEYS